MEDSPCRLFREDRHMAFQTDDLDAFDSDCDDVPLAKAVLMANLSSYDSNVLSEVPSHDTNIQNDMSYQKTKTLVVQSTSSFAQQDALLMSVIEEMSSQVAKCNKESKKKEDIYLDEVINLQNKNKALDNVVNKMALRKVHALYDGNTIVKRRVALSVTDSEETLELAKKKVLNIVMHANDHSDNVLPANNNSPAHVKSALELVKHENDRFMEPLISQDLYNRDAHVNYLKHTQENADTLREIIEHTRELRPLDSNLDSALEISEEEVAEIMAETMEECMSKTRADYGSGVTRPKVDDKDHFELKVQFLKELRDNTFSGSDHEDANEHIEKVLEVGCELCKRPHYTKDCPLKVEGKTLEEAYYTQFGVPFQQGGQYRAEDLGFYQMNNANHSYQERRQSMEESLSKFINESANRHEENSNLIKEIRASTDAVIANQEASIKPLEIQIGKMSKSISTNVETEMTPIRRIGSSQYVVSVQQNNRLVKHPKGIAKNVLVGIGKFIFPVDIIILDMPEDVKVPLILRRSFLSTAHAKIDEFKRKITLRVGDKKIIFKYVKPSSSLIKCVYMLSLRERMELDLEAMLMGETLILNRSLDPLYGYYIKLNDLNV
ncbi:putative reverse transcriptase domain-containing protein [Tanacetum coccineum]